MGQFADIFDDESMSFKAWEERLLMGQDAQVAPPPVMQGLNAAQQANVNKLQGYLQSNLSNIAQQAAGQILRNDLLYSINPLHAAMNAKLLKLSTMLPVRLLAEIDTVSLRDEPLRIEVQFKTGKKFAIDDLDGFPSEEHAARIALECP